VDIILWVNDVGFNFAGKSGKEKLKIRRYFF
jgi:hypothetical protein